MSVQRTRRYLTHLTLSLAVAISLVMASLEALARGSTADIASRSAAAMAQGGLRQREAIVMPAFPWSNGCAATFDDGATVFTGTLAVQAAIDAAAPGDTVKIAGSCSGVQQRMGISRTLFVSKSLTLQGGYTMTNWLAPPDPAAYPTSLDAQSAGGVVHIGPAITVTLGNLTLTGGKASSGGGIFTSGSLLTVERATIVSNTAGFGGGIFSTDGRLILHETSIVHNEASNEGGGLFSFGDAVTMTISTISDNNALFGGGLSSILAILDVSGTTIAGNVAVNDGGGIFSTADSVRLENCTLSGNAAGAGGGIMDLSGRLEIKNSTISGNSAISLTRPIGGGGIASIAGHFTVAQSTVASNTAALTGQEGIVITSTGALTVSNSILAHNGGATPGAADCTLSAGVLHDGGYNLESGASCGLTAGGSLSNTDPLIDPLADHGGWTWTHALLPGSPAIDHIPIGRCPFPADQRGVPRPQEEACDVGAYEWQKPDFPLYLPVILKS